MDAGCRVECSFCRVELLEACLYCMALECCREPYSWSLPCGVLGDTGAVAGSGVSNETNEACTMYIEEFILVDIWIHCCTSWNLYYTVLYTELD